MNSTLEIPQNLKLCFRLKTFQVQNPSKTLVCELKIPLEVLLTTQEILFRF